MCCVGLKFEIERGRFCPKTARGVLGYPPCLGLQQRGHFWAVRFILSVRGHVVEAPLLNEFCLGFCCF